MANHYLLTDEQLELQKLAREFAEKEIMPYAAEWDEKGEFPQEAMRKGMDVGFHLMSIPEEFGGMGLDNVTSYIIREELAKGDAGYSVSIGTNGLGMTPLLLAGNDKQKQMLADIVVPGALTAFCLTEAQGGSDAVNSRTTAVKEGEEYVITAPRPLLPTAAWPACTPCSP